MLNRFSFFLTIAFHLNLVGIISAAAPANGNLPITFHRDIAPILFRHCAECHREGQVAPFALLTYQDAAKRAEWLSENVVNRRMPPWKAEPNYGHFVSERRMSEQEIKMIATWAKEGAPEGNPEDAPPAPTFHSGWSLGEPDLILEAPHEVTVPADGPDIFHHWLVDLKEAAGREISAVEFRPGNPRVVHHSIVMLDASGQGRIRDAKSPEPGYVTTGWPGVTFSGILTIWAPGVTARHLPEHVSLQMPTKGDVLVQLHLHPSGKVETDRSRIGIYFSKKPAERHIMNRPVLFGPVTIDLPPGAKDFPVETSIKLPVDIWLTAILPHMHLLGKELKISATLPDGKVEPLIWVKDWDFNWQDQYIYQEPVHLPAGSVIKVAGLYDNSTSNPHNPRNPPVRILFGEETTEEMCFGVIQAYATESADAEKVTAVILNNILRQIGAPGVADDLRKSLLRQFGEVGKSELQGQLRKRLVSQQPRKSG
ncbi:ascorbate-dependent monooxygenase [bacterium]|nr:ascorbate-dependent monooxygenase [bacterium]